MFSDYNSGRGYNSGYNSGGSGRLFCVLFVFVVCCCCWSVVLQCLNCFQDFHLPVWFGYCVLFLKDLAEIRGMQGSSFYQLTVTL